MIVNLMERKGSLARAWALSFAVHKRSPWSVSQGLLGRGPLLNRIARLHARLPGAESPFTKA